MTYEPYEPRRQQAETADVESAAGSGSGATLRGDYVAPQGSELDANPPQGSAPDANPPQGPEPATSWPPPESGVVPQRPSRKLSRVPTAVKVLVASLTTAAVAIAAIWAAGGLAERETVFEKQIGEILPLGPVKMTLDRAVAQQSGTITRFEIDATCELGVDQPVGEIAYRLSQGATAGFRDANGEVQLSDYSELIFGIDSTIHDRTTTRTTVSPGMPPIPCLLKFTMPAGAVVGETVQVFVFELTYAERSNVRNDAEESKTWEVSTTGYYVRLPVVQAVR